VILFLPVAGRVLRLLEVLLRCISGTACRRCKVSEQLESSGGYSGFLGIFVGEPPRRRGAGRECCRCDWGETYRTLVCTRGIEDARQNTEVVSLAKTQPRGLRWRFWGGSLCASVSVWRKSQLFLRCDEPSLQWKADSGTLDCFTVTDAVGCWEPFFFGPKETSPFRGSEFQNRGGKWRQGESQSPCCDAMSRQRET
jgi:hypothetical protein